MSEHEDPELPEVKDPFERQVALTVAILAVILSVISGGADNARLKALLASSQAVDQWAYYQSKSVKGNSYDIARKMLGAQGSSAEQKALMDDFGRQTARYQKEKADIEATAHQYEERVTFQNERVEHFERGEVLLHIAIVLGSITILVRMRSLWWLCLALGFLGLVMGVMPFFQHQAPMPRPEAAIAHRIG